MDITHYFKRKDKDDSKEKENKKKKEELPVNEEEKRPDADGAPCASSVSSEIASFGVYLQICS